MRIVSNNICYEYMPEPDKEVEQHLTINDEGRVWFSGYNFGHSGERYEKARSKNFKIEKVATNRLLCAIATYFEMNTMKFCYRYWQLGDGTNKYRGNGV